jgi:PAS domain S-box-containing protein
MFHHLDDKLVEEALQKLSNVSVAQFPGSFQTAKGTQRWWHFRFSPLRSWEDGPALIIMGRDLTDSFQAGKARRESEEAFRKIFEEGPMPMLMGDLQLRVQNLNSAFSRMLGYSEEDLAQRPLLDIVHPEDISAHTQMAERLLNGESDSFRTEKRYFTKRKEIVWGHMTVFLIRDAENRPAFSVAMIENINERKQAEVKLLEYQSQLQSLASTLSLSEERERRRIARNLHDRIGQCLAFAKLKLSAISHAGPHQNHDESIHQIRALIEQAMGDTRSLTFELSPPVLYELGLVAAIEWLARRFQQEHGILTRFHDDGLPKNLDEDFRIVLFQAVRELLVNIVKHAQATHVQVLVRRDGDALRVIVEDDGAGFDLGRASVTGSPSGFGLFSIRERLDYLGGQVKIRSEPGEGTRITLIAPLRLNEGVPDHP